MVSTSADDGDPSSADPVERLSDRPNFVVLGYAWLNAMQPNKDGKITYCSVMPKIPADKCKEYEAAYTPAKRMSAHKRCQPFFMRRPMTP